MKVFKIVTLTGRQRVSFNTPGEPHVDGKVILVYNPGEPTVGSIGPLFAFRNLVTAKGFLWGYNGRYREIWECDAVFHSYGKHMVSYRGMTVENITAFWRNKKKFSNAGTVPTGTVFCKSITLTKRVWQHEDALWKPL